MKRIPTSYAILAISAALAASRAHAVELLTNGNLEIGAAPEFWSVTTTITDLPGATAGATEQVPFANEPTFEPGELGLFVRPFAGNQGTYADQNQKVNVVLSQTFTAGQPGRTYTFKGHSYFGGDGIPGSTTGYSGGVEFMDILSPSDPEGTGTVESPTDTFFTIEFLNAANSVLGANTLDLRTVQMNDAMWRQHSVAGVAPAGTSKVRVSASALNMVENFGFQDLYLDNFSLSDNVTGSERLQNAELTSLGAAFGFTAHEVRLGADPTIGFREFADHTHFSGQPGENGFWLRSFAGGDGDISQTVPGVVGGNYTFSAWSAWQPGYSGDPNVAPGTTTDTFIKMEFLNAASGLIGSPIVLDLADAGQHNDDEGQLEEDDWRQYSVNGMAPAGTAFVRVTAGATGMFNPAAGEPQSAMFDDLSLNGPAPVTGPPADFDGDSDVDGADFLAWQRGFGIASGATKSQGDADADGAVDADDFLEWRRGFGESGAAAAVPEPATLGGAVLAAVACLWATRRRVTG